MSLQLMKARMNRSGLTAREEMIRDGQNILQEELEHDASYSPTAYFYDPVNKADERLARMRIYSRQYSSLNGNYQKFLTTYDNPVKIGDYIHDTKDDTYWLVYYSFNVNDTHYEGKMIQCNYLLRWQLSDGSVVERHANIVSASKYDTGTTGNSVITLGSNNYTVLIGFCEEGFELEDKRVFIDIKTSNPTKVFKLTRADDVLYNSDNLGGLLGFIADKTELRLNVDRPDLRLCDYVDVAASSDDTSADETAVLTASIVGNSRLKVGFTRTYLARFTDGNGNEVDWNDVDYSWNIVSDFNDKILQSYRDDSIGLLIQDDSLEDSVFTLQLLIEDTVSSEIEVTVIDRF